MLATLPLPTTERRAGPLHGNEAGLYDAVMRAVLSGSGGLITVEAPDATAAGALMTKVRVWLLVSGSFTGGVSATVAPSLLGETYPAMLGLIAALERANAGDLWSAEGARTVRFGQARHIFVSADSPVGERTPSPDRLLEVVDAHRIQCAWFDERVAPRARSPKLTTVMFGQAGFVGSVFERERTANLAFEAQGRGQRHFVLEGAGSSHEEMRRTNVRPGQRSVVSFARREGVR